MTLRIVGLFALLIALSAPATLWATVDTGYEATLVGFVGDGPKYALFMDIDVGGEGHCHSLYLVELDAEEFAWLRRRPCAPDLAGPKRIEHYLEDLEDARFEPVAETIFAEIDLRAQYDEPIDLEAEGYYREVELGDQLARYRAVLRLNSRVRSMANFEAQSGAPCRDRESGDPICAGCTQIRRSLDGEPMDTPICTYPPPDPECDCTAMAFTLRFLILDTETGESHQGNRLFITPSLLQLAVAEVRDLPNDTNLPLAKLRAYSLPDVTVFWGAVGHAPMSNGTFFPVVAVVRHADGPDESERPADDASNLERRRQDL